MRPVRLNPGGLISSYLNCDRFQSRDFVLHAHRQTKTNKQVWILVGDVHSNAIVLKPISFKGAVDWFIGVQLLLPTQESRKRENGNTEFVKTI